MNQDHKYTYGDKVKIVGVGHPIWTPDIGGIDLRPDWINKEGVITGFTKTQGTWSYSIHFNGESGVTSWFQDYQIEKI